MKVKIGDIVYDADEQPIMIILSDDEKKLISNMPEDCHNFCVYPDEGHTEDEIEKWMNE